MEIDNEKLLSLKGNRRILINTLLQDARKFLFMDIEEIARELNTTPSTLSRIIKAIGFKRFKDFRSWIATKSGFVSKTEKLILREEEKLLEDELQGVESLFSKDILEIIDQAASLIAEKGFLIIACFGPLSSLGEILNTHMKMADIICEVIKNSKHDAIIASHLLGKEPLLLLIDILHPYKEAIELLTIFRNRKIPRITLTAIPYSRIGILSDTVIPIRVDQKHPVFPLAPVVAIIDLLGMKVIRACKTMNHHKKQEINKLLNDSDLISK